MIENGSVGPQGVDIDTDEMMMKKRKSKERKHWK
jgi:hypothetical protein